MTTGSQGDSNKLTPPYEEARRLLEERSKILVKEKAEELENNRRSRAVVAAHNEQLQALGKVPPGTQPRHATPNPVLVDDWDFRLKQSDRLVVNAKEREHTVNEVKNLERACRAVPNPVFTAEELADFAMVKQTPAQEPQNKRQEQGPQKLNELSKPPTHLDQRQMDIEQVAQANRDARLIAAARNEFIEKEQQAAILSAMTDNTTENTPYIAP